MPDLNMDRVVELLKAKGVSAYVEQTGGGVATIFAGPSYEEPDYGTRYAACAGPGTYGWRPEDASMGHTDEFCVGADDYGDGPHKYLSDAAAEAGDVPVEQEAAEDFAAQMIYDRVVEWAAEKMVGLIKRDMEAGVVPTEWVDFSELHSHVDANMQYVHEVLPLPEDGSDVYFDLCGKAIERVEATFDTEKSAVTS